MDKELHHARVLAARRILLLVLVLVTAGLGVALAWAYLSRYNETSQQAAATPVRELIIQAVKDTKTEAPVEPRTGDFYFPPAKLYLPYTSSYLQLTYGYDPETSQLSVGNATALKQGIASLYNARNLKDIFEKVPYLQACQRGVTITYEKILDSLDKELRQTVQLNNGKTVYLYTEKLCPELNETVELLTNLRAY